jgi:hypothetical protein
MIGKKCFCDICHAEIKEIPLLSFYDSYTIKIKYGNADIYKFNAEHVCDKCSKKIIEFLENLYKQLPRYTR